MRNNTNNRSKIIKIIILCVSILVCGAILAYLLMNLNDNPKDNSQFSTPVRSESDIQQSERLESDPGNKETRNNTDSPAPLTTDNNTNNAIVQMVSSYDISDGTLFIRGGINNSIEYDGLCFALLTGPNGEIIRKETTLLQNASTTDCKTVSIPISDLQSGRWKFSLNYLSDTKNGHSDESFFDI